VAQDRCAEYRSVVRHGGCRIVVDLDAHAVGQVQDERSCDRARFRQPDDGPDPEIRKRQAIYDPPQRAAAGTTLGLCRPGVWRQLLRCCGEPGPSGKCSNLRIAKGFLDFGYSTLTSLALWLPSPRQERYQPAKWFRGNKPGGSKGMRNLRRLIKDK